MTTRTRSISPDSDVPSLPRPTLTPPCPPQAQALHRLAALITEDELPPARIALYDENGLSIGPMLGDRDGETTVRRWAQALSLIVTETPHTADDGTAERLLLAQGNTVCGYVSVAALLDIEVAA